jgi:DNA-binding NtrC family response regulator
MPELRPTDTAEHLPPLSTADSPMTAIVRCLVGQTVEEVERELILCSLSHYHGNRTYAARVLGISVRTMRNKIG